MMNYIWAIMLLSGAVFAFCCDSLDAFTQGLMESCENGVMFLLTLSGIMAMWSGFMNIAHETGLIDYFARLARPFMRFLFSKKMGTETEMSILMSFAANFLGAGSSSTVFALRAMRCMDAENLQSAKASNDMCMFMAINMSMVQLLPVTIIKLRTDAGSANPGDILIPSILAGLLSMIASVLICKWCESRRIFS